MPTPAASHEDLKVPEDIGWKLDRNCAGILREPEVLRLVEQHRSILQACFWCYATEMESETLYMLQDDLVSCLRDLNIVPTITSRHEALRVSSLAVCREKVSRPRPPGYVADEPPAVDELRAADPPAHQGTGSPKRSGSRKPSKQKTEKNEPGQPPRLNGFLTAAVASKFKEKTMGVRRSSEDLAPPESDQEEKSALATEVQMMEVFGLSAFIEVICRLCLRFLISHGNSLQLALSSEGKMCWILIYLRSSLRSRQQRDVGEDMLTENSKMTRLERLLHKVRDEEFDKCAAPILQKDWDSKNSIPPPLPETPVGTADRHATQRRTISRSKTSTKTEPAETFEYDNGSTPKKSKAKMAQRSSTFTVQAEENGLEIGELDDVELRKDAFAFADLALGPLMKAKKSLAGTPEVARGPRTNKKKYGRRASSGELRAAR